MPDSQTDDRVSSPRLRGAVWAMAGILLFALSAAWAVATPLMASPDETSHVVKAAAVARGQWSGTLGASPSDTTRPGAATTVRLPADLAASVVLPNCFAFHPEITASCAPGLPARTDRTVPVETFAGQYPPLYYALVGWPSLFLTGRKALFAMRLVSAAISAAMLLWGAFRLRAVPRNALTLWGAAVAVTPMCLFLAGTVNPTGWEIAVAFSFWAACLAIVSPHGPGRTSALVQAVVCGALLINIRASSPVWALVIVVVALVVAPPGRIRELIGHRLARPLGAVAVLASIAALGWLLTHGSAVSAHHLFPQYTDPKVALLAITGWSYRYLQEMIGNFGWLDTPAPAVTYVAWHVAAGCLILIALSAAVRARSKVGLCLLVAGVGAAPFLQFPSMADAGLIWQGRYTLPIAVGVPLLAALLAGQQHPQAVELLRRVFRGSLPLIVVGHVAAFYWAARRYSEGANGELITLHPDWSSPIGFLTGTALYAVLCTALGVLIWRSARPARLDDGLDDEPDAAPDSQVTAVA